MYKMICLINCSFIIRLFPLLRSVSQEERSFALGMQFVIFRVFGYIPSPIMFGNVIDSTCILWKAHCGRQGGFCLMYNIEHFRLRYIGVCSGLKVASALLFFLDWLLISWRQKKDIEQPTTLTVGELVSSIVSLDRISTYGWSELEMEKREDGDDIQPLECTEEENYNEPEDAENKRQYQKQ